RCPHLPHGHRGGRARGIKSKGRVRARPLPAFRPRHRPGWDEVHNLELRESVAETRLEPRGPLEQALALNTPASWQPIRHATRVAKEGEHLVDWSANVVDERVGLEQLLCLWASQGSALADRSTSPSIRVFRDLPPCSSAALRVARPWAISNSLGAPSLWSVPWTRPQFRRGRAEHRAHRAVE